MVDGHYSFYQDAVKVFEAYSIYAAIFFAMLITGYKYWQKYKNSLETPLPELKCCTIFCSVRLREFTTQKRRKKMFGLILAMVFSVNLDDRLPEVSLEVSVKKFVIVSDSVKIKAPKEVTWDDMNKLDPKSIRTVKPSEEFVIVMDNW